jgi:hypothetical protein
MKINISYSTILYSLSGDTRNSDPTLLSDIPSGM